VNGLRRLSLFGLVIAAVHLVFGAIVRITGSGMGCGDHWPKCYGRWFPPLDRPDLIIEISHRYLAALLVFTLLALVIAASPAPPSRWWSARPCSAESRSSWETRHTRPQCTG
jgi:heme A synthase